MAFYFTVYCPHGVAYLVRSNNAHYSSGKPAGRPCQKCLDKLRGKKY